MHIIPILVAIALLWSTVTASAWQGAAPVAPMAALGNGFTYQGYLTNSAGVPVHDICDFRFSLYSVATGGTRIGASNDITNVQVDHGRFTVTLNAANEFGSQPFDGSERYLAILVVCDHGGPEALLSPRQPLRAAPYAIYALNIPAHDHAGESWTRNGTVLTLDNTAATGDALTVNGTLGGFAIRAEGGIHSSADSKLYLNPASMVVRSDSTNVELLPQDGGGMMVGLPASATTKYLQVPVPTFGTLFGAVVRVKAIKVCYNTQVAESYITNTAVVKNSGASPSGEEYYINDPTNRTSTTFACYTVTAATPRVAIDNTTWVQFNMVPLDTAVRYIEITTIELTLTEELN